MEYTETYRNTTRRFRSSPVAGFETREVEKPCFQTVWVVPMLVGPANSWLTRIGGGCQSSLVRVGLDSLRLAF